MFGTLNLNIAFYNEKKDKVISQHDTPRHHVAKVMKKYLESIKFFLTCHTIQMSDFHIFCSTALQLDRHMDLIER